jgi:hypothetical protein
MVGTVAYWGPSRRLAYGTSDNASEAGVAEWHAGEAIEISTMWLVPRACCEVTRYINNGTINTVTIKSVNIIDKTLARRKYFLRAIYQ